MWIHSRFATTQQTINPDSFDLGNIVLSGTSGTINEDPVAVGTNSDRTFQITVTGMTSGDTAAISLPAGSVSDLAGNTNSTAALIDNSVIYLCDGCDIIDTDSDGIEDQFDNCADRPNPDQLQSESCTVEDELCIPVLGRSNTVVLI